VESTPTSLLLAAVGYGTFTRRSFALNRPFWNGQADLERYRGFGLSTVCCLALTHEQEAEERSIDLPTDDPEIVGYMLRFIYQRDYQLPSDDAPRPFWIRWKTATKDLAIPVQEWLRAIDTAVWSHSSEALEKLREQRSDLVEAYHMA
jgi:hypothetical protein